MRITEATMLAILKQGGCIRTFFRRARRHAGTPPPGMPDGYVLESADQREDTPLTHIDFSIMAPRLVRTETWSQVAGREEFGGETWRLQPDGEVPAP